MNKVKAKEINQYKDVRTKIIGGLGKLSAPIVQTLTPKGKNVLFEDHGGLPNVTNDGYTLAQHTVLEDPVENLIVDIVKQSAIRTNQVAGDGTTTTILLSDNLIRQGFGLIDNGTNPMDLKRELDKMSDLLVAEIPKYTHEVKTKADLRFVAKVSSNNDTEIAENVATIVDKAKLDGMVFIEPNPQRNETKIIEELGFLLESPMFAPQLANQEGRFVARYEEVPVLITDKKLYYEDEVISILQKAQDSGFNNVVIVAADFIGASANILIANHTDKSVPMNILFMRCPNSTTMDDLSTYLGGQVFTEKRGSMVKELKKEDFIIAQRVYSDQAKTIFSPLSKKNVSAELRVKALREAQAQEDEDSREFDALKKRIAAMTNGTITVKVGARTQPELMEKIYRYEDSINATRNALRAGYVVGGGVTLYQLYKNLSKAKLGALTSDVQDVLKRFCEASFRQIAINCNKSFPEFIAQSTKVVGYNALTDTFEDLLASGIIEPAIVLKSAIENSISVAGVILSSDFIMTNIRDKDEKKN